MHRLVCRTDALVTQDLWKPGEHPSMCRHACVSVIVAVGVLCAECLAADTAVPATFSLRNGRTRRAFFLSMVNDTVTIGIKGRDGARTVKRLPKGHFISIELRDGTMVDLAATNYVAPPAYGTLIVRSRSFPGTVLIDGVEKGATPYSNAHMQPGDYALEVAGDGVKPVTDVVPIVAGQVVTKEYLLERTDAWLANAEKVKQDSIQAVRRARRDSLETLARARENEAFHPSNMQADLDALFARLAPDTPSSPVTVAVVPFEVVSDGVSSDAGAMAAEYGVVFFTQHPGYVVVERSQFSSVVSEIALSQTGLVPQEQTLEAGRQLSASMLVVGSVNESMGRYLFSARLVDTETGEVLSAAAASMAPKDARQFYRDVLGERLSPSAYAFRSAAVPGWGQLYSGHAGHGVVSLAAFLGASGVLAWSTYDYMELDDQAMLFKDHDPSTVEQGETAEEWSERANDAIDARNDAALRTNMLIGAVAGVWVVNVIDALILGAVESRSVGDRYFSMSPQARFGLDGMSAGLSLHIGIRNR